MSDFVFLNLPENYRLVDALSEEKDQIWWRTTRLNSRINVGDRVFLWQGRGGQESFRGIHAVAEVIERPRKIALADFDTYWATEDERATADEHTHLKILERAPRGKHLRQNVILNSPLLRERGVFQGAQGVNFTLSVEEADELYRLWQNHVQVVLVSPDVQSHLPLDLEQKFDETARDLLDKTAAKLLNRSLDELELLASKPNRDRPDETKFITIASRPRDPAIVAYARVRAGNSCEAVDCPIPLFTSTTGVPFVEVHHIKPLAQGGMDAIDNVACLCPSHHREAHHGQQARQIELHLKRLRRTL
ncbi:hypothetical protein BTE77_00015 [Ensifer adhaerens]|nr:hypothetical protein BTE77_00015 [Ensifer adhaerens]